jgi:amino acid permease
MSYPDATTRYSPSPASGIDPRARRLFSVSVGLTVFFIFVQSLTAGEFITDGLSHDAAETWTEIHGFVAYPVMVFALLATVVAASRLRGVRGLLAATGALFVGSVAQWLLGHAITTLGWDWVTPFHVVLAFVIYGLAIWLSVKTARLRKSDAAGAGVVD